MIREDVCIAMLRILKRCQSFKLPQTSLFERVRTHMVESVPQEVLLDNAQHIESLGWAGRDTSSFQTARYWLTEAGDIELSKHP